MANYCEICGDEIYTGARCDECQPEFCKCCGEEMGEDGCRSCASEDARAHAADMANDIDDFNDPRDL